MTWDLANLDAFWLAPISVWKVAWNFGGFSLFLILVFTCLLTVFFIPILVYCWAWPRASCSCFLTGVWTVYGLQRSIILDLFFLRFWPVFLTMSIILDCFCICSCSPMIPVLYTPVLCWLNCNLMYFHPTSVETEDIAHYWLLSCLPPVFDMFCPALVTRWNTLICFSASRGLFWFLLSCDCNVSWSFLTL